MFSLRSYVGPVSRNVRILIAARYSTETGSKDHISNLVKNQKIVLFMKGTPDAPMCGFSNAVVQIFKFHGVTEFDAHNVLADDKLREGMFRNINHIYNMHCMYVLVLDLDLVLMTCNRHVP